MKRLTVRREDGRWAITNYEGASPTEQMMKILDVINQLAAYEDTGLTPEDLKPGLNAAVRKKLACEYFGLSTSQVSRIEELVQADKDGKLEVLPIDIGTDVFALRPGMPWCAPITACSVKNIVFHPPENGNRMYILAEVKTDRGLHIRFSPEDIGRTVFFTHEEAEKELAEVRGDA